MSTPNETGEKPNTSSPRGKRHCRPYLWPLYRSICGRSDAPILVGPWKSEVGFEILYWLPFLARFAHDYQIPPDRLMPITRGGAGLWYGAPTAVELFSLRTPQEVRVENRIQHQRTGQVKQTHVTAFDRQVIRDAADTLHLTRYRVLHPAWMYQTLRPFWEAERGLGWLDTLTRFAPLPAMTLTGVNLPEKFVAVRFYFRPTLPASPTVVAFAKHTIRTLAKSHPVVILNNPDFIDDHFDYVPKDEPNVSVLSQLTPLTPQNNLAVQAAVLQRAMGYVGTYGGMAQLALRLGKPSISFYDDWHGTALPHKHLSEALSLQTRVPFLVLKIGELPMLQEALPKVIVA